MAQVNNTSDVRRPKFSTGNQMWFFPLSRMNFYYLMAGLAVILIGYALMATGITDEPAVADGKWNNPLAVTVAPIMLILGYCVIIPLGLLKNFNKKKQEVNAE